MLNVTYSASRGTLLCRCLRPSRTGMHGHRPSQYQLCDDIHRHAARGCGLHAERRMHHPQLRERTRRRRSAVHDGLGDQDSRQARRNLRMELHAEWKLDLVLWHG